MIVIGPGHPSSTTIGPHNDGNVPPEGTVPSVGGGIAPLQSNTANGGGHIIVGGVTSTFLVMIWVQVLELPHTSVARKIRVVVSIQPFSTATLLTKVIVTAPPQPSVAVSEPASGAGTVALHPSRAMFAGQLVITGAVTSTLLVINCVQVDELPHTSVARKILVVVSIQPFNTAMSLNKVIVTAPPQPSVAVNDPAFGAGTVALHPSSATFAGQLLNTGPAASTLLVIV